MHYFTMGNQYFVDILSVFRYVGDSPNIIYCKRSRKTVKRSSYWSFSSLRLIGNRWHLGIGNDILGNRCNWELHWCPLLILRRFISRSPPYRTGKELGSVQPTIPTVRSTLSTTHNRVEKPLQLPKDTLNAFPAAYRLNPCSAIRECAPRRKASTSSEGYTDTLNAFLDSFWSIPYPATSNGRD